MLYLTIRKGGRFIIAPGTEYETVVQYVKNKGTDAISLGITSPFHVLREELLRNEPRTQANVLAEVAERVDERDCIIRGDS